MEPHDSIHDPRTYLYPRGTELIPQLPVIVVSTTTAAPATLAMTMEGIQVKEYKVRNNDYVHYGSIFTELWQTHEGFILVEGDVVPWPGAIKQLQECNHNWCGYLFPSGVIDWELMTGFADGLGCMKFGTGMVQRVPYLIEWQNTGWDQLDGSVHATVKA